MENYPKFTIFFLLLILSPPIILSTHHHVDGHGEEGNTITNYPSQAWGKVKSLFGQVTNNYFPSKVEQGISIGAKVEEGESNVKSAAETSLGKGEEVLKETAESAAKVAGEAVNKAKGKMDKAKEMVKEKMPSTTTSNDDQAKKQDEL